MQIFQLVIREGQLLSDIKAHLFLRKFQPVIIGAVQIASEKLPYFLNFFASDNRGRSDFQVASTKMPSFLRKRYVLIKAAAQIFK